MNKIIETFIDNSQYREIKESTKKSYKSKLKSLYNFLDYPEDKSIIKKILNYKDMILEFNTREVLNPRTKKYGLISRGLRKNYIIMCMFLLDSIKYDEEEHKIIRDGYKKELMKLNKDDKQTQTETEKEAMTKKDGKPIMLKDLKKVALLWRKRYSEYQSKENLFHLMVALLYTNIRNCVRRNIFSTMKIIFDESKDNGKNNFLLLSKSKKQFIINCHKTDRKKGTQKITLPRNSILYKVIMLSLENGKREYLLMSPGQNKPLDSSAMTKAIKKTFASLNDNITSTVLRKIFITEKFIKDTPVAIRNNIADLFGHSVETSSRYYEKKYKT